MCPCHATPTDEGLSLIHISRGAVYEEQTGTPIPAVDVTWTAEGITSQVKTDEMCIRDRGSSDRRRGRGV